MAKIDLRPWALKGAEQRLAEIVQEATAILEEFPELRRIVRGFSATGPTRATGVGITRVSASTEPGRRPRRRKMSRDARKRISDAQKARWAKQRAASTTKVTAAEAPSPAPTARKKR